MLDCDQTARLVDQVKAAAAAETPVTIVGGGTKAALGQAKAEADALDVSGHSGILSYEPAELVLRARAGTPLTDLEAALEEAGQMLPFEPPHLGAGATLGGCVATGLSGPRRAFAGSVRDYVLGINLVTGTGEVLKFGGEVMKNVAGYDVSRLQVGAMGTLGVILDVSMKVLPKPANEVTLAQSLDAVTAHEQMKRLARTVWPATASAWHGGTWYVRIAAPPAAMSRICADLGGEEVDSTIWRSLRELETPELAGADELWRASVGPASPAGLATALAVDWNGGLRFFGTSVDAPDANVMRLRGTSGDFLTSPGALHMQVQRRLKDTFDPARIFNPGRLYDNL